jgi:ribonuclease Z
LKNPQDTRFAVIAEIERQASEAWGDGKAIVAYDFMRISIPGELSEEDYAEMDIQVDVEEVLEIEVGDMSRGPGRGRARGAFRGTGRGGRRGQWRGRGRGRGGGGDGDRGVSGRSGKKRKFGESADASASTSSLARGG